MELEETCNRFRAAGFLLAAVTIGSLMTIGYAATRPRGRVKRLSQRLDRELGKLESKLRLAS